MPDLIEKYFQEDLTEAEQSALEGSLLNSDEAALKFEALAKEAYVRYGLPEPQPHWGNSHGPFPSAGMGFKSFLWVLGVGAGLAMGLWHFYPALPALMTSATTAQTDPTTEKITQDKGKNSLAQNASKTGKSVQDETFEGDEASRTVYTAPKTSLTSKPAANTVVAPQGGVPPSAGRNTDPAMGQLTPVNVDLNPPQSYSNLSVVVGQSQLGYLTVRVVDPQGMEVVNLYRGNLGPGNWAFQWDGKLPTGQGAKPGLYQIEVRSGTFTQRKNIQIQ